MTNIYRMSKWPKSISFVADISTGEDEHARYFKLQAECLMKEDKNVSLAEES